MLCKLRLKLLGCVFLGAGTTNLGRFKKELKRVIALGFVFNCASRMGREDQGQNDGEGKKDLFHAVNMRKAARLFNNKCMDRQKIDHVIR